MFAADTVYVCVCVCVWLGGCLWVSIHVCVCDTHMTGRERYSKRSSLKCLQLLRWCEYRALWQDYWALIRALLREYKALLRALLQEYRALRNVCGCSSGGNIGLFCRNLGLF